ncbi:MAG: universal stress protein [Actinomycetia bacterium]|nr:universal stress protein [Actinomycetes bacterium]
MSDPIVVGTDGSPDAGHAVTWAISWARAVDSPLRIIASEAVPPGRTADSPGLGEKARAALDQELDRLRSAGVSGIEDFDTEALVAHPVSALIAESQRAAAVVVGTRGSGAYQGGVIGSISGAVAASAHCPTIVVPGSAPPQFDADGPIVVGFDGSEPALGAARLAISAANAEGRTVRLVQAEAGVTSPDEPLDDLVEQLRSEEADVEIEFINAAGSAVQALTAESRDAAFVVMASQGHRGVPGFLLGSTTRALVQQANTPVIVLTARSEHRWPVRTR